MPVYSANFFTSTRARTRAHNLVVMWVVMGLTSAVAALLPDLATAQDWTAHTSLRQVQALDSSPTHIWVATTGGVFSNDIESGEIERYTVVDGLHGVEPSTLVYDGVRDYVWIGYGDGVIDRLDIQSGNVFSFLDISRAQQFASRGINRLRMQGDSILVATDFGIVVFDAELSEVRDTYSRLGATSAATKIRDVIIAPGDSGENRIWAATIDGVASASMQSPNLQDPSAWALENTGIVGGTNKEGEVFSLAYFNGKIYAGTGADMYVRNTGIYSPLSATSRPVNSLLSTPEKLLAVSRFNLIVVNPNNSVYSVPVSGLQDPTSITVEPTLGLWSGDFQGGLQAIGAIPPTGGVITPQYSVIPNGPYDGLFSDLMVTADGTLWAGGSVLPNSGFYRLDTSGEWTTYSSIFTQELEGTNRYLAIYAVDASEAWAASTGSGVAHVAPDGAVTKYDKQNSSLVPIAGSTSFIVAAGIARDAGGYVWTSTMASAKPLHVRAPAGEWQAFNPKVGDGLTSRATAYNKIFIDSFDQKWIIIRDENDLQLTKGVMVLDTGDPLDESDDEFNFFGATGGSGQGLPSVTVTSVAEDRDGLVWIGTSSGPAYFVNTGLIAIDDNSTAIWPQWADRSNGTFMLFGLRINDLAVDPANRIWFATGDGAWLVESVEGGYQMVHHFTAENSPLFSNEVTSVAIDSQTGRVYFGTDLGLVSFEAGAVAPRRDARDLFIYPNPVRFTDTGAPAITIDGLVEQTEIRILTPGGSLVRSLTGRGGRVTWDARNEFGQYVESGVYIVAAIGQDGEGTAYGKIAVIR